MSARKVALFAGLGAIGLVTILVFGVVGSIIYYFFETSSPPKALTDSKNDVEEVVSRHCELVDSEFVSVWNDMFEQTPENEPNYVLHYDCSKAAEDVLFTDIRNGLEQHGFTSTPTLRAGPPLLVDRGGYHVSIAQSGAELEVIVEPVDGES